MSNTITRIDLSRFCASDLDSREHIRTPWRVGEWVYATNGHFAIRVRASDYPEAREAQGREPNVGRMFADYLELRDCKFQPVPDVGRLDVCKSCGGKGKVTAAKCEDCEDGEFTHGFHTYECKNCEDSNAGPGWIDVDAGHPSAVVKTCENCDGHGYSLRDNGWHQVGRAYYAAYYLHLLGRLPNAEICPGDPVRASFDDPREVPAVFRFDGGHALLMPTRP